MATEQPPVQSAGPSKGPNRKPWIMGGCVVLIVLAIVAAITFAFWRWRATSNEHGAESPGGGSAQGAGITSATPQPANPQESAGQGAQANAEDTVWKTNVADLNGKVGQTLTLACTPGGKEHSVWGSDIYTADSSICTAAVHAGLITFERGGTVTVEVRPGRYVYGSTQRNGVNTSNYGAYGLSFVFKTGTNQTENREAEDVTPISWTTPAFIVSGDAGQTFKFECPAGGSERAIWGTDVYTADSSVCTAAVHAGKITFEAGGRVTVELRPGQSSYQGTSRNGVKSSDYGAYGKSFVLK